MNDLISKKKQSIVSYEQFELKEIINHLIGLKKNKNVTILNIRNNKRISVLRNT